MKNLETENQYNTRTDRIPNEVKKWFPIPENEKDINREAILKPENVVIPESVITEIKRFLYEAIDQKYTGYSKEKPDGVVLGLSGGLDSSTLATLCQRVFEKTPYLVKSFILGRGKEGEQGEMNDIEFEDVKHALRFVDDLKLDYEYFDISRIYKTVCEIFPNKNSWEMSGILPRLRGLFLNQYADNHNSIALGSTNGTEYILTSWTVGGPGGHFEPLIGFYKSEVYEIARQIGVPDYILKRKPGISELGLNDEELYGGNCYLLDPILRMLYDKDMTPSEISQILGHSEEWIKKITETRIKGEEGRRIPPNFNTENETISIDANTTWDRSYFIINRNKQ